MKETDLDNEHGTVKERILKEALYLFSERGFEGASLQSIADAVGIQKPSLIYHFPSKEDLRRHVLESLVAYWKNELPRILTPADSSSDRLVSTMTSLINFFVEDLNRARLVVRELLDRPEETFALLSEQFSPWTRLIGDYLRMGQQSGLYRKDVAPESFSEPAVQEVFAGAATVFVNAVMGYTALFTEGTKAMYSLIDKNTGAQKLFGGGDTIQDFRGLLPGIFAKAVNDPQYYFFTGGGAVLASIVNGSPYGMKPVQARSKEA